MHSHETDRYREIRDRLDRARSRLEDLRTSAKRLREMIVEAAGIERRRSEKLERRRQEGKRSRTRGQRPEDLPPRRTGWFFIDRMKQNLRVLAGVIQNLRGQIEQLEARLAVTHVRAVVCEALDLRETVSVEMFKFQEQLDRFRPWLIEAGLVEPSGDSPPGNGDARFSLPAQVYYRFLGIFNTDWDFTRRQGALFRLGLFLERWRDRFARLDQDCADELRFLLRLKRRIQGDLRGQFGKLAKLELDFEGATGESVPDLATSVAAARTRLGSLLSVRVRLDGATKELASVHMIVGDFLVGVDAEALMAGTALGLRDIREAAALLERHVQHWEGDLARREDHANQRARIAPLMDPRHLLEEALELQTRTARLVMRLDEEVQAGEPRPGELEAGPPEADAEPGHGREGPGRTDSGTPVG